MAKDNLDIITELSHEFGTDNYVKGGGGNTSTKTGDTLWVKPSGTTLAGLNRDSFVVMDRAAITELYSIETPKDWTAREALVKDVMGKAVKPESTGRPSVEAPLHNAFDATFVVHTHPSLVNGMTCAKDGKKVCMELFPDCLWMDFIDPGYMLCMVVREEIEKFKKEKGFEPKMIFLKNHGVFVAGETAEEIREIYSDIFNKLSDKYAVADVDACLEIDQQLDEKTTEAAMAKLRSAFGDGVIASLASGFTPVDGPLTPDHIVYAKAYVLNGEPTKQAVAAYVEKHGHEPRVVCFDGLVATIGQSQTKADLAMIMAIDAAMIAKLVQAFGGLELMTQQALDFINNWEVESYRSKQIH